jgi:hypothetical protein
VSDLPLVGWVPIRLFWVGAEPQVEWCYLGNERFTEPFFDFTIHQALQKPFNRLFRRQTTMATLREWRQTSPGLDPSGFIFHVSRCGSTVVSGLLATMENNVVVSEAGPIDALARAHQRAPGASQEQRIAWLQWMVSALGQPRSGAENRYFIKFDALTTLQFALLQEAFPDVPWIFVYRDPVEVLVAMMEMPRIIPGMGPNLLPVPDISSMTIEEYAARVLGLLCDTVIQHFPCKRGMLVNYRQLPDLVWSELPAHFGLELPAGAVERMQETAAFNIKDRTRRFESDSERRREEASEEIRRMAAEWVQPQYEKLESLRLGMPGVLPHGLQ